MILALAMVKRPSDLNILRITLGAMQISEDSVTFQPMFGAKNPRPNHSYCPTITLRWPEDECLCPVRLIKEYLAKTKDREDQSDKLFVTRKMGPAVAVSIGTIASWLKETLNLANIRASGGSTRKAAVTYVASQGASIRTTKEDADWAHTSTMYRHYIRYLLLYNVQPINWYIGTITIKHHSKSMGDNRDSTVVLHQEISTLPLSIASDTRCF